MDIDIELQPMVGACGNGGPRKITLQPRLGIGSGIDTELQPLAGACGNGGLRKMSWLLLTTAFVVLVVGSYEKLVASKVHLVGVASKVHLVDPMILEEWNSRVSVLAADLSKTLPSYLPSPNRPFVFFHMRKGGGSSIRSILWNSARKHAPPLDAWIPCQGGRTCVPFSLPPANVTDRKAVYAGHVNYAHMAQLVRETAGRVSRSSVTTTASFRVRPGNGTGPARVRGDVYQGLENDRADPFGGCLTNIRPTVDRVESCWNYRMANTARDEWKLPMSTSMTPEEWSALLPDAVDQHGNGCNNEVARILGDTPHEAAVNRLSPETYGARHYGDALDTVLGRMAGCVIVRVDRCADSNAVLRHFLPWVRGDLCTTHQKKHKEARDVGMSKGAMEAILSQNRFDELVFSFGAKLFEAQLAVAMDAQL